MVNKCFPWEKQQILLSIIRLEYFDCCDSRWRCLLLCSVDYRICMHILGYKEWPPLCEWFVFAGGMNSYTCIHVLTHTQTHRLTHTHRMSHRSAQSTVSVCRSPGADRITHPWNRLRRHNVHIHQRTISHVSSQVDTCTLFVLWQRLSLCLSKHYTESTLTILNQSDNIFDDF